MAKKTGKITETKEGADKEFKGSGIEGAKESGQGAGASGQSPEDSTTPPAAPLLVKEGSSKRTSLLTITNGKAVRVFFEEGKEVGREEA